VESQFGRKRRNSGQPEVYNPLPVSRRFPGGSVEKLAPGYLDRVLKHFWPYDRPYRERSKIPKNAQNRDFHQKIKFFQSQLNWSYGRYMAGNMSFGYLRHVLRHFLIYGASGVHFSEIQKKSRFRPFIGYMVLGGCLGTLSLFLARMAAVRSGPMLLYSTITKKSPNSENHGFLQSKLYKERNSS